MEIKTPWRSALYREFSKIRLKGSVLDLGGSRKSGYSRLFDGDYNVEFNNLNVSDNPDFIFDLEKKFPINDKTFDNILLINVLEHVYSFNNVLLEANRVLKPNGFLIIAVPFIIQIHPSPNDFWRFSGQCLSNILNDAGFFDIKVKSIGGGPFSASFQVLFNVIHFSFLRVIIGRLFFFFDFVLRIIIKSDKYSEKYYPLGYLIIAKK